jgi:AcrR family transcriptional regulator
LVLYHFSSLADVLVAALESVEDEYYAELAEAAERDPRDRLVEMALLSAEGGPAFGDWKLWLEVWVRGLHDERIDALRRVSDQRWRAEIAQVVSAGVEQGLFTVADLDGATLRIACLQDGLAVQAVLGGADVTPERMAREWLVGAARELRIADAELLDRIETLQGAAEPDA